MLQLQFEHSVNNIINEKWINEVKEYKNVIVFGAGESGEWVMSLLRHYGIMALSQLAFVITMRVNGDR